MSDRRYKATSTSMWDTNFIADARVATVENAPYKVAEGGITCFEMADNSLIGHISEWPSGIYHKAHYHAAGAILLVVRSYGYIYMWPKELGVRPFQNGKGDQVVKCNWKPGSIYSPPDGWFHTHLNSGPEPARHIALRLGSRKNPTTIHDASTRNNREGPTTSLREGGTLIEYEDEDPEIHRVFLEECKRTVSIPECRRLRTVTIRSPFPDVPELGEAPQGASPVHHLAGFNSPSRVAERVWLIGCRIPLVATAVNYLLLAWPPLCRS